MITLITQTLWAIMLLLFLAGALTFAFNRHLGLDLLKRSAVLLAVVLIGPSLLSSAVSQIPFPVLLLFGIGACLAAYGYVTSRSKSAKSGHGSRASHAERQPHLPHEQDDQEES